MSRPLDVLIPPAESPDPDGFLELGAEFAALRKVVRQTGHELARYARLAGRDDFVIMATLNAAAGRLADLEALARYVGGIELEQDDFLRDLFDLQRPGGAS